MKTTDLLPSGIFISKKHVSLISTLTMINVTGVTIGTALLTFGKNRGSVVSIKGV